MRKMLYLSLMMFVGLFFVATSDASAPACQPGPNQVALFEHVNYGGKCVVLDAGELYNVEDVGFPNDQLSSVKFGSNIKSVELFEHINLNGKNETFGGSVADLTRSKVGNDVVSSMRINLK